MATPEEYDQGSNQISRSLETSQPVAIGSVGGGRDSEGALKKTKKFASRFGHWIKDSLIQKQTTGIVYVYRDTIIEAI